MKVRRWLTFAFAALSIVAVLDITRFGFAGFTGVFEQTFDRVHFESSPRIRKPPEFEETRVLDPVAGARRIVVEETAGELAVTRSPDGEATVEYTVQVWGRGDVEAFAKQVSLAWKQEGDTARLVFDRPAAFPEGVAGLHVDIRLAVPDDIQLVASHFGEVEVEGIAAEVELHHTGGELSVSEVRGPVEISSRFSVAELRRITGPVVVEQMGGTLTAREIDGELSGELMMGQFIVDSVTGGVRASVAQGSGRFRGIGGDLDVSGNMGELDVGGVAGRLRLEMSMGSAVVRGLANNAELSFGLGELNVTLAEGTGWTVDARGERSEIRSGLDLELSRSGGDFTATGTIGDGAHELLIRMREGELRLGAGGA